MAPTLYSYFKSKDELFEAYVRGECARFEDAIFNVNPDEAIDRRLTIIGQRFLERLLSERAVRTFQVVVAEAHWSPGLARAFYEAGPAIGISRLTAVLEVAKARGEIAADDCEVVAWQFMALCRGELHLRRTLNMIGQPTSAEITDLVVQAVGTLLARFGTAHRLLA